MTVALYARVSTADKDQNPDNQILLLKAYASSRGMVPLPYVYVDKVSGSWAERPALNTMLKHARMHKFDTILCVRVDRLGRSAAHLLHLLETLKDNGIRLIFTEQGLDTGTMEGKLIFTILGAVAEMELDLIKIRTREGLARAKAEGKRLGRPMGGGKKHTLSMTKDAIRKRESRKGKVKQ